MGPPHLKVKRRVPVSRFAVAGLVLALLALAAAFFGCFFAEAWLQAMERQGTARVVRHLVRFGSYLFPVIGGVAAALFGVRAQREIEAAGGRLQGDGPAVFAVMIGLLAAVAGAAATWALLVWPNLFGEAAT